MSSYNELGKRMKTFYEQIPKTKLMRRTPVIIRVDGKAFHTFTKGFQVPFDDVLIETMQQTMKCLCESIQGCVLGYCQSDEISLVLVDYKKLESAAWFDYEVQKMCSVAASIATLAFNKNLDRIVSRKCKDQSIEEADELVRPYLKALDHGAMFDARVFNIPKEEVTNYFYWRQLDASRNSVEMVGHANFTTKELHGKSCNEVQDMLILQKGINWNNFPTYQKRGSACFKEKYLVDKTTRKELPPETFTDLDDTLAYTENAVERSRWVVDKDIPIFKGEEGRCYIERLI